MEALYEMIRRHEGLRLFPYQCTEGEWTIGYGRNLEDKGISRDEANLLLENDISECELDLNRMFAFNEVVRLSSRRNALIDMRFQLGAGGFRAFTKMIEAIRQRDWDTAADEALNSLWAQQTPERAQEIAKMLREG